MFVSVGPGLIPWQDHLPGLRMLSHFAHVPALVWMNAAGMPEIGDVRVGTMGSLGITGLFEVKIFLQIPLDAEMGGGICPRCGFLSR